MNPQTQAIIIAAAQQHLRRQTGAAWTAQTVHYLEHLEAKNAELRRANTCVIRIAHKLARLAGRRLRQLLALQAANRRLVEAQRVTTGGNES